MCLKLKSNNSNSCLLQGLNFLLFTLKINLCTNCSFTASLCISSARASTHTYTEAACASLEASRRFSSRASECFGVIRGVCSILPEGGAAWRIKSPTCLCFSDLCCPGNRCWDFPFLHFSLHYPYQPPPPPPPPPLRTAAASSSPTTCRIVQSHTHTSHVLQTFHSATEQSSSLLHYRTKPERLHTAEALTLLRLWVQTDAVFQQRDPQDKEETEEIRGKQRGNDLKLEGVEALCDEEDTGQTAVMSLFTQHVLLFQLIRLTGVLSSSSDRWFNILQLFHNYSCGLKYLRYLKKCWGEEAAVELPANSD